MIHTAYRKGQRIIITLKTGKRLLEKYLESKSGRIITDQGSRRTKEIRAITIYRGQIV